MDKLMMRREFGSPETDDMDFKDVFGGPPRRFSMQEVRERHSFGEPSSSAWEKPVFGEEKRRQRGPDFFDDIFKGSPRRSDRDGSSPASRIMSPFSPKPDALASSLPAHLSLPPKMDLPTFGSQNHGQNKVDGGGNGLSSWSPFSRFSNEASGRLGDLMRDEAEPASPPQRPLSDDEAEGSPLSDQDPKTVDSIGNQFHFSIYKWAGRGAPVLMPLVLRNNLRSKDSVKCEVSAAAEPEPKSEPLRSERAHDIKSRREKKQHAFEAFYEPKLNTSVKEEQLKSVDQVEKKVHVKISEEVKDEKARAEPVAAEPEPLRSEHAHNVKGRREKKQERDHVVEAFYEPKSNTSVKEEQLKSVDQVEKKVHVKMSEEIKDEKARAQLVDGGSKKAKEKGGNGVDSNNAKAEKTTKLGPAAEVKSGAVKGKVKDFVQIFNQDAVLRPEADARGSRRWGNVGSEASSNQAKVQEKVDVDKKPDAPFKEAENLGRNEAQQFSPRRISRSARSSSRLRKSFSAGSLREDLRMPREKLDDPLEDTFEVQELPDDNEADAPDESSEETKAIDAKIRQWSVGKKGNIRSLLSTLQYVLWAESGWKPVPLVDLIESTSVKRAYQKALLRLHPDKLQQKGAAFQHKYIAEKVFDILQEAWDHFNTCSSLGL
ncbi:J domain-containing protein required for chloroplast accumulation response 1 [Salvia hispanica]|uniref:J domain-containing protein required for chloroplast accumulation response 1 n=1 Tax=Salvia hispanica TaxID=49212 RepID=UPI0020091941|nr:J domain-containing protein required for chloroplast accumulation response 1 [Salvia hispanica]